MDFVPSSSRYWFKTLEGDIRKKPASLGVVGFPGQFEGDELLLEGTPTGSLKQRIANEEDITHSVPARKHCEQIDQGHTQMAQSKPLNPKI